MVSKENILIHKNELKDTGMEVMALHGLSFAGHQLHRDDHYMFLVQTSGYLVCEVDFNRLEIRDAAFLYIAPGQVHRYIQAGKCEGWLFFVNPDFVLQQFRNAFDIVLNRTQNLSVSGNDLIFPLADLLGQWWSENIAGGELAFSVGKSLLDAVCGMLAARLLSATDADNHSGSPKFTLANRFRQLIKECFKTHKQVKQYASLLHITPLYLNEVMQEVTGFAASYWIHQEIVLEAKRLLVYSGKNIREISWELGYEDDAYFSRFFKKHTGLTASAFRVQKP